MRAKLADIFFWSFSGIFSIILIINGYVVYKCLKFLWLIEPSDIVQALKIYIGKSN